MKRQLKHKPFSTYVIPELKVARKRLKKETKTIRFNLDEKLIGFGKDKY